jgi:hypothetical protein
MLCESGEADVVRTRVIVSAARKLFNFTQMLIERRTLLVEAHKGRLATAAPADISTHLP